jgi:hypothetical protein
MLQGPLRLHLSRWKPRARGDRRRTRDRPAPPEKASTFLRAAGRKCYARLTCSACRPFGPRFTTNDTRAPSSNERYPLDSMAEKWTKTSSPFSRWIKPNPLAALNHFTVPVSFMFLSFSYAINFPHGSKRERHSGRTCSRYVPTDSTACKDCKSSTRYHVNGDGYNPMCGRIRAVAGRPRVFNCLQRRQKEQAPVRGGAGNHAREFSNRSFTRAAQ